MWALPVGLFLLLSGAVAKVVGLQRRIHRCEADLIREAGEHRRAEAALARSETCYAHLFEHLSLGLFQTTLDGRLLRVNQALAAGAGYGSPQEMMASVEDAGREFYIPEFYRRPACQTGILSRIAASDSPVSYEVQFRRKTGETFAARVTLRLVDGGPQGDFYLEGSLEDLTERKQALECAEAQRDLGIQLSAISSLASALPLCLQSAIRAAGMDSGEIYVADADSNSTIMVQSQGLRPEGVAGLRPQTQAGPAFLRTIDEPVYSTEGDGSDGTCGARAVIPLRHEGAVIGWVVLRSHTWRRVPAFSRTALESVGAQIGSAIVRIQVQEALLASQRELKALFDSLNDFLVVVDSDGFILDANRSVIERSGYTKEELRSMYVTKLYPLRLQLEDVTSGIFGGELNFLSAPMVAKDGTVIPVETRLGLGNWDGQHVVIGLGRDLTERRKAEEQTASLREKTALLQEIHHRIKNNLQIICSLLSLQARRLGSGPATLAFAESRARVRAIALLHEKLYQSRDLSRIELGEYLGALAEDVLRAYQKPSQEIHLRLHMDPAWLNQDTVMPCGLIVNELVTNSCKYAFPENEPGEIFLSVTRDPDGAVVLEVGDNGAGLPPGVDPRKTTSLGLQLVSDMVSQMKGTWTLESSRGTRVRITFPVEEADGGRNSV